MRRKSDSRRGSASVAAFPHERRRSTLVFVARFHLVRFFFSRFFLGIFENIPRLVIRFSTLINNFS